MAFVRFVVTWYSLISEVILTQGHTISTIQRQRHRKNRSFTYLALNTDLSTQKICELLDNGESQARAAIFLDDRGISLMKPLEDLIQILLFDANSGVRDGQLQ